MKLPIGLQDVGNDVIQDAGEAFLAATGAACDILSRRGFFNTGLHPTPAPATPTAAAGTAARAPLIDGTAASGSRASSSPSSSPPPAPSSTTTGPHPADAASPTETLPAWLRFSNDGVLCYLNAASQLLHSLFGCMKLSYGDAIRPVDQPGRPQEETLCLWFKRIRQCKRFQTATQSFSLADVHDRLCTALIWDSANQQDAVEAASFALSHLAPPAPPQAPAGRRPRLAHHPTTLLRP